MHVHSDPEFVRRMNFFSTMLPKSTYRSIQPLPDILSRLMTMVPPRGRVSCKIKIVQTAILQSTSEVVHRRLGRATPPSFSHCNNISLKSPAVSQGLLLWFFKALKGAMSPHSRPFFTLHTPSKPPLKTTLLLYFHVNVVPRAPPILANIPPKHSKSATLSISFLNQHVREA